MSLELTFFSKVSFVINKEFWIYSQTVRKTKYSSSSNSFDNDMVK